MKRLHCVLIGLACLAETFVAQEIPDRAALVGTWQQVDSLGRPFVLDKKVVEYKIITPQTFTVIQALPEKGIFGGIFMGEYTLEGDTYIEKIRYCNPNALAMVGSKNLFTVTLKDGILLLHGINNTYNQRWKKTDKLPVVEVPATDAASVKRKADGGSASVDGADGSSVEKAVVVKAKTEKAGVSAEYEWVEKHYGQRNVDWVVTQQQTLGVKGRNYDLLFIRLVATGKELKLYFDITDFFGKF